MTEFAWFRLLVRAIGLLLIGMGGPALVSTLWWTIAALRQADFLEAGYVLQSGAAILGNGLQFAFGLYLLLGGKRIIRHCLQDVRGLCAACGYDLSGNTTGICPECGAACRPVGPAGSGSAPPASPQDPLD